MPRNQKEVFSCRVSAGNRFYFFDVKQQADGGRFLSITEAKRSGDEDWERSRIIVDQLGFDEFFKGLSAVWQYLGIDCKTTSCKIDAIREHHPQAYKPWSAEDNARLEASFTEGKPINQIAAEFGRKPTAIRSRLRKLGRV